MLCFRLFGFPIRIHWMFWVLCAFLGLNFLEGGGRTGALIVGATIAIFIVCTLCHELCHAFMRKHHGAPNAEIKLQGVGGYCSGPGKFTPGQAISIALAGPMFHLILSMLLFSLWMAVIPRESMASRLTLRATDLNMILFILHVLPVMPLDGGHIFSMLMASRNPAIVPWIGMVVAMIVSVIGAMTGWYIISLIFSYFAYQNVKMIRNRSYRGF